MSSQQELQELYDTITTKEEDFILSTGKESKVIMANKLLGKVKAGEVALTSKEE